MFFKLTALATLKIMIEIYANAFWKAFGTLLKKKRIDLHERLAYNKHSERGGNMPDKFILHSNYKPTGDQPEAIAKLTEGVENGLKEQVLLGVTGSGKTFTMANIIANVNKPTLVLAHNKTLAAQLCSEFREFFPENAVEYFVSYQTKTAKIPYLMRFLGTI